MAKRELTISEKRFDWIPKILNKTFDYLPEILLLTAGLFIGATGVPLAMSWVTSTMVRFFPNFTDNHAQLCSYLIGTLITVVNVVVASHRKKNRTALELDLRDLRAGRLKDQEELETVLKRALKELSEDLDVWNSQTRASLYRHSEESQSFIRVARVSHNPKLCQGGRRLYPDSQGLISTAWTHGEATARDLKEKREEWNNHLVESMQYDLKTASELTMHSRSMVGLRLDYDHQPVGVVIIENEKPRGVKAQIIDDLKESDWLDRTAMLFAINRENILALAPEVHTTMETLKPPSCLPL